ncbi:MAG: hypothetical protein IPK80_22620 [Nannocystis sp.]|nr:hypothetical protein [Nannocystis sp.]
MSGADREVESEREKTDAHLTDFFGRGEAFARQLIAENARLRRELHERGDGEAPLEAGVVESLLRRSHELEAALAAAEAEAEAARTAGAQAISAARAQSEVAEAAIIEAMDAAAAAKAALAARTAVIESLQAEVDAARAEAVAARAALAGAKASAPPTAAQAIDADAVATEVAAADEDMVGAQVGSGEGGVIGSIAPAAAVAAETPETVAPETVAPETVAPETVAPETVAPETVAPETAAPETAAPGAVASESVATESSDVALAAAAARVEALQRQIAGLEAENYHLASVYIGLQQLHATRSLGDLLQALCEILLNFLGVGGFTILAIDEVRWVAFPLVREGGHIEEIDERVLASDPPLAAVAGLGRPWQGGDPMPGEYGVLFFLPLHSGARLCGIIAVESLLAQKDGISDDDLAVLAMLSEHAGLAFENLWLRAHAAQAPLSRHAIEELVGA